MNQESLPPSWAESLPEEARPLATELATYFHELPRLLETGQNGRYALIKGAGILSLWDTLEDALQAGYERFGPDVPFMTQRIDPRHLGRLAAALGLPGDECPS
jgi:hypothetical protein